MRNYKLNQLAIFAGFAFLLYCESEARVGGGNSYGGGSRSSGGFRSSGGGSGDAGFLFDILFLILRLCFRYPVIGIPLLIAVIIFVYIKSRSNGRYEDYYSSYGTEAYRPVVLNRTRDYVEKISE